MIEPRYYTLGKPVPAAIESNRFDAVRQINTLTAERDQARRETDILRLRVDDLEVRLAIVTSERDEARALGRSA
ncbi:hypothetical protein AOQ73_05710 [Bradyrhizobium pachyrhizi]|uniref:hypothetical protein n=1 Tax=Bradyrhizobium pachyrhizi TaxID=280333 RepID=UPI000704DD6C|nr:hypothetical protein [Bradyrhizobium pachyrhizi]KRQ11903.1 hypothetical protein AOQ73_05710 [Bradyrhizobium pachyrhizi]